MLITEKRLRQIVSSELKRMFLREALDPKQLPSSNYKSAWVELDKIMKRAGAGNPQIYANFSELAQLGNGSPKAAAIAKSLQNPSQTPGQKFQSALVSLLTGKEVRVEDMKSMQAGKPPASLGLDELQLKNFLAGMDFEYVNNLLGELVSQNPADVAKQALSSEKKTAAPTGQEMPVGIDYVIKQGDTISAILSTKYGIPASTSSTELYDLVRNLFFKEQGIPKDANTIKVGMKMRLPDNLDFGGKLYKRK